MWSLKKIFKGSSVINKKVILFAPVIMYKVQGIKTTQMKRTYPKYQIKR